MKSRIETPDQLRKKADFVSQLIDEQPVRLHDKLYVTSIEQLFPVEVSYTKNPDTGVYTLASPKQIFHASDVALMSTAAITHHIARNNYGAPVVVCKSFGQATRVRQQLLANHVTYKPAVNKHRIKYTWIHFKIQLDYSIEILKINLTYRFKKQ